MSLCTRPATLLHRLARVIVGGLLLGAAVGYLLRVDHLSAAIFGGLLGCCISEFRPTWLKRRYEFFLLVAAVIVFAALKGLVWPQ